MSSSFLYTTSEASLGIELRNQAYFLCKKRLDAVIAGEQTGISKEVNWVGGGGYKFYELAEPLLVKNPILPIYQINPSYTWDMVCEAICKIEGFTYDPSGEFQGYSSENRFIHITEEFVNSKYVMSVMKNLGDNQSLIIYCKKNQADMNLPENVEVKKIPKDLLEKCNFGAIMDAVHDSLTVLDIEYWNANNIGQEIRDSRLASFMNVRHFYMPSTKGKENIPVASFPYTHVCTNDRCKRLFDIREELKNTNYLENYKQHQGSASCPDCHYSAYPARFISICEDGHMDDFPWRWWCHNGKTDCKEKLRLKSFGTTSSLAELEVECDCGAKRRMSGSMQKENFDGCNCTGNHPQRPNAIKKICKKKIVPSQRGASNVYFPVTRTAISIPPWTNPINDLMAEHRRDIDLRKQFPNCTDAEINDILSLCFEMYNMKHSDSIELVITAPETFRIKTKKTRDVVEKLIKNAEKSVVMTGYSISDYFTGMLDTIIAKSQQGVYVRFYVNDIEKSRASLVKMLAYRSKYLQFFEYEKNSDDKMAASHAKILTIDSDKSLVSSANLSYHGLSGNIEMGFLVRSADKAKQIEELLKELVRMHVYKKIS